MKTIDHGYQSLNGLAGVYRNLQLSNASESDTRGKVIDSFVKGVLYWTEDDITREERVSEDGETQFIDYVLRTATVSILVEAKKAGAAFTLPNQRQSGKLGGWLSSGEVGEAIRQARDYCRKAAIPFAVVTNGSAWIVFPAVRTDGVSFEETQARVFRSIADIEERFVEFWELLSRQRVIEGNLEHELVGQREEVESPRLLSIINEPGYRLGRNALFDHIELAVNLALSDEAILDDAEALAMCYVKTSERVRFDRRLNMHLADVKPALDRPAIRVRSRKGSKTISEKIARPPPDVQRSLLVLGPVGAGKSTFLSYTRTVSGRSLIEGKILWLQVDFKKATASDSPRTFIYSELLRAIEGDEQFNLGDWEHSIRPAYREEIEKLERGVLRPLKHSDPDAFEQRISEMILDDRKKIEPYVEAIVRRAAKTYSGYLVIDNVDQLETDEAQNKTFVEAQAIARKIGINLIMAIRDTTYLRHRNAPVFNAFQIETMFIDPPRVIPVLSRRFAYGKKLIAGQSARIATEGGATVVVDDLGVIFDIVSRSMLTSDAGFMLEVLAGGDIRRGLQLAREFLASGHTNADLALQRYMLEQSFTFPSHEIFKGAVLGSRRYYREEESLLVNVFDSKLGHKNSSLLRLHLCAFTVQLATQPSFEGIRFEQITEWLHLVGIPESDVRRACSDLVEGRVLRTSDGLQLVDTSTLLPTRLAGYLIHELCASLQYVEMCVLDAHVYEVDTFDALADITRRIERPGDMLTRIGLRLDRVERFLEYVRVIEQTWAVSCKRKGVPEGLAQNTIADRLIPAFREERQRVMRSAQRRNERELERRPRRERSGQN